MQSPLAPMDWPLKLLTGALLPLPLVFFALATLEPLMSLVGAGITLVYLGIWFLGRPSHFGVDGPTLRLQWPARSRQLDLRDLDDVEVLDLRGFRDRVGYALRVGAGGLWGVFGWLVTGEGWVRTYISRRDGLLLLRFSKGPPLLISPEEPERFAEALRRGAEARG